VFLLLSFRISCSVALVATTMRGAAGMNKRCRDVDGERDGSDADLEEATMQGAQAGDDAKRNALTRQLGAGATESGDATATTDESAHRRRGAPVILEASKAALVQQLRWQRVVGKCGAFLNGE
jgi:hypothetical protein